MTFSPLVKKGRGDFTSEPERFTSAGPFFQLNPLSLPMPFRKTTI
jgi:hypothetical protein